MRKKETYCLQVKLQTKQKKITIQTIKALIVIKIADTLKMNFDKKLFYVFTSIGGETNIKV